MIETSITKWIKKKIQRLIAIVEDGDTATHSIASGKYVVWKGDLYKASTAIAIGTTLSTSNLTAVSDGGLNEINGNLASHERRISSAETNINGLKSLIVSATWNSSNSVTISGANIMTCVFIGYLQGTGNVALKLAKSGSSLGVYDLTTGNAFSSSYVSFTLSGNNIVLKSTATSISTGTLIISRM